MAETAEEREQRERANRERDEELRAIPFQPMDKSKWPKDVRPVALGGTPSKLSTMRSGDGRHHGCAFI